MAILHKIGRAAANAWRFISEADTTITVLSWIGFSLSGIIAVYVAVRAYLEGAPWLVWVLAPLLIFAVASAATYYSLRAIDWWKNRGARELRERYKNFDESAEKELLDYIVEGEQAIRDVASEMMKMNKDTHRLARKTKFATF